MSRISFRKYHGLGNDFIIFDGLTQPLPLDRLTRPEVATRLCERHTGIGADGLLLIGKPRTSQAQARMRIFNADGSEPEMCGNGIRCVAKAIHDHVQGFAKQPSITIDTGAGPLRCDLTLGMDGLVRSVRVTAGRPSLERVDLSMQGQGSFIDEPLDVVQGLQQRWTAVSMGNPHLVTFIEDASDLRVLAGQLGPLLETHPLFPNRTNVEFARMSGDGNAEVLVWERGCGITQACGTGACAVAVAAGATDRHPGGQVLAVHLPGGTLEIQVAEDKSRVWMDGPAEEVFKGEVVL